MKHLSARCGQLRGAAERSERKERRREEMSAVRGSKVHTYVRTYTRERAVPKNIARAATPRAKTVAHRSARKREKGGMRERAGDMGSNSARETQDRRGGAERELSASR